MSTDNLLNLLDRPIAFHRAFVDLTGSITGALLLSQACYWQKRCTSKDGWWWKTYDEWRQETGLTSEELKSARKACSKYLEWTRKGLPARNFYKVNVRALADYVKPIDQIAENPRTGQWKTREHTDRDYNRDFIRDY